MRSAASPTPIVWRWMFAAAIGLGGCKAPDTGATVADPPTVVRVALCQIRVSADPAANLARIEAGIEQAAGMGADLAVFPEACVFGWVNGAAHAGAASIPGATTERIGVAAARHGLHVVVGLAERDGPALHNSVVLLGPAGEVLLRHRKVNVLAELMEPPYTPGVDAREAVVETEFGRIGLLICADTFRDDLVAQVAAAVPDLVLVPYGWAAPADAWPEHARSLHAWVAHVARRCGVPAVGVDAVGELHDGPWRGHVLGGQSVACGADGAVLTVLADRDEEIVCIDLPIGHADR